MKMNWGAGIALTLVAFVAMLTWFATRAVNNGEELVAEDYYKREIAYQSDIDLLERTRAEGRDVEVEVGADVVILRFTPGVRAASVGLMRPSDRRADRFCRIAPDTTGAFVLDTREMIKGLYQMRVEWNDDGGERLSERTIVLQ
jgi:hypothetical protein